MVFYKKLTVSYTFFISFIVFYGCQSEPSQSPKQDHFDNSTSLRILEPSNGATVESVFEVTFEAGSLVNQIDVVYQGGPTHEDLLLK